MTYLSLCMIVRNAENTIDALLDSIENSFDEYIFVDTGSTDRTKEKICSRGYSVIDFEWADDFALARNFAFEQATGLWRGYLDADDVFPDAPVIKKNIQIAEQNDPRVNGIAFQYAYKENDTYQDVVRFVKWGEGKGSSKHGWRWQDEIHESLVCMPEPRFIYKIEGTAVYHNKSDEELASSFERNQRIATKAYLSAIDAGDPLKAARMAYHLAQFAKNNGDYAEARKFFRQVDMYYGDTNLGVYSLNDQVRMYIDEGDFKAALVKAGELVARFPEIQISNLLAACVHTLMGDFERAKRFFQAAESQTTPKVDNLYDMWFNEGYALIRAAECYLALGDFTKAGDYLYKVPKELKLDPNLVYDYQDYSSRVMKEEGVSRITRAAEYFIWNTEPRKALLLLHETTLPPSIRDDSRLVRLRKLINKKIEHLQSWEDYKEAYASIPPSVYHTGDEYVTSIANLSRTKAIVEYASNISDEKPLKMLSIGFQDGIIEELVLNANKAIHLTVCDVAPQSNKGLARLKEIFGDRICEYKIEKNEYDWGSGDQRFDIIIMFEVLEHLGRTWAAFSSLRNLLSLEGRLFISVPSADKWIEPYLTGLWGPEWYGHVQSFTAHELWLQLTSEWFFCHFMEENFDGTLVAEAGHSYQLTGVRAKIKFYKYNIGIFVPQTPTPFNAFTHDEQALGGSEECVIHLANHLSSRGNKVVVYAPRPRQYPIVHVNNNVLWRDPQEFDADDAYFDAVLYWRCPSLLPEHSKHKRLLWLHDAYYGADTSDYQRADKVIVLSEAHKNSVKEFDLSGGDASFVVLSNGIDDTSPSFAPLEPMNEVDNRDPFKFIYSSSPDRGLEILLELWPEIKSHSPDVTLDIFYDWSSFKKMFPKNYEQLTKRISALSSEGVTYYGGVPHEELHRNMRRAGFWAYPNSGNVETFCITAIKMCAAGVMPIVTDAGALHEVVPIAGRSPVTGEEILTPEGKQKFLDTVLTRLENLPSFLERAQLREHAICNYSWVKVSEDFDNLIDAVLEDQ